MRPPEGFIVATDVGGTCTDRILVAPGGRIAIRRALSTPHASAHGLTEEGMKDPVRTERPAARVAPDSSPGVPERVDCDGDVIRPHDLDAAGTAVRHLVAERGVEARAVSFLWSFYHQGHERAVREIAERVAPGTYVTHSSDIAPVHFEGTLIAWSACFVRVHDIGAMSPGGFSPQSADVCTEGFSSPGLCIMRGGELVQDVVDTLLNMVRSPETVMLDLRSMIACKNVARERMQALAAKYGAKAVGGAGTTLIRQPRALLRERPRELPDGEWQSRRYLDVLVETATVRLSMRKTGDRLVFDFAGSGPQSRHAIGCTRWASLGGLFAPLFPLLCHDITRKAGAIRPVEMIAPEGSIVNCTRPAPVSVATVAAIQPVNNAARATIGRLLAASDRYRDQAAAVWHANQFAILKFGRNRHGGLSIRILTATFAGAGGARAFAGGIDGIPGTRQDVSRGVHPLMGRDSLHVRSNGGGYGDPLDREPGRVAADVATGLLGAAAAAGCIPSTGSTRPGPPSSSSTCRAPSVRPAHRPRCPPPAASSRRPTGSRGRSRRGAPR